MAEVLSAIDPLHTSSRDGLSSSNAGNATDWHAKYNEAADMLAEARNELDDFVHSSKELEEELLRELERNEKLQKDLKDRCSRMEMDKDEWKNKYIQLQTNHNTVTNTLQRELDTLRKEHQSLKVQFRDLELGNDDLERTERAISSSLADVEAKYARVLEEKIILEQELLNKAKVEEEAQRLRDEMRDANSEIQVLRDQLDQLKAQQSRGALMTPPTTDSSASPPRADNGSMVNLSSATGDDSLLDTTVPADVLLADDGPTSARPVNSSRSLSIASSNESSKVPSGPRPSFSKPTFTSRTSSGLHSRSNSIRASPNKPSASLPNRTPRLSQPRTGLPASKSKGVQMVSEMRARVRNLEQKLHTRVPRLRSGTFDKDARGTINLNHSPNPMSRRARQPPPESPGWVLVMEESPPPRRVGAPKRTNSPPPTAFPLSISSNASVSGSEADSPTVGGGNGYGRIPGSRRSFTRSQTSSTSHASSIPTPSTSRPSSPDSNPLAPNEARSIHGLKRTSVPVFAGRTGLGSSTDSSGGGLNASQRSSSTVGKRSMGPPPVPSGKLSVSYLGRPSATSQTPTSTLQGQGSRGLTLSQLGGSSSLRSSQRSAVGQSRIGRPLSMSARRTDTGPGMKSLPVDEYGQLAQSQSGGKRTTRSGSVSQFGAPGETF